MKEINIVLFGIGNVGKTVIPQLLSAKEQWEKEAGIKLKIPVIANSTKALFKAKGITKNWKEDFSREGASYSITDVLNFIAENKLENTIAVDATASKDFVGNYLNLIKNGFHIVAANKIANTISTDFYQKLREELSLHKKLFLYETNVGAGLPVVETVKNLYKSGEKITKIRGVFSGSLSYIFNRFSEEEDFLFSKILLEAGEKGYTEPDAREDLSGNDVGRKLLVLARELQLQKEFEEIDIQSLIPEQLNGKTSAEEFKNRITELDDFFSLKKSGQNQNSVLRYIGEIDVESGKLEAKLISEPKSSPLGQLKGADNLVEIFTESYAENPLVIQGAGAGAAVTARGVVSDILKIAEKLNF